VGDARSSEEIETSVLATEDCLALLEQHRFGRLAVVIGDGAPIIRPVNYAFDPPSRSVVVRTDVGSKLLGLLSSARAAFEIDEVDEATHAGWSVIVVGVCEEVTAAATIGRFERLGLETWAPGEKAHWIQIHAWSVSGRRIARRMDHY
jgi:nitroimidazol reductase NimA-like FMN-containing flavoprotein (pyridoxamine 5'-phosphate oxidase superfamily)